MMSIANRLMHETEAFFDAFVDTFMGRGGDGVPGSSVENFYRPEEAQTPVINIHTDAVTMNAATVHVEQEAAPLPDAAQREAAFYDAMRQQQEAEQDQQLSMGR
jgi:hypothetical protein